MSFWGEKPRRISCNNSRGFLALVRNDNRIILNKTQWCEESHTRESSRSSPLQIKTKDSSYTLGMTRRGKFLIGLSPSLGMTFIILTTVGRTYLLPSSTAFAMWCHSEGYNHEASPAKRVFVWDLSLAFEMTAEIPRIRSEWHLIVMPSRSKAS